MAWPEAEFHLLATCEIVQTPPLGNFSAFAPFERVNVLIDLNNEAISD